MARSLYQESLEISRDLKDRWGMALWLGNPKGLEDFLVSLLEKREAEKIRRFLARKGIPDLPGDETETIGEAVRSAEFGASPTPAPAPRPCPAA